MRLKSDILCLVLLCIAAVREIRSEDASEDDLDSCCIDGEYWLLDGCERPSDYEGSKQCVDKALSCCQITKKKQEEKCAKGVTAANNDEDCNNLEDEDMSKCCETCRLGMTLGPDSNCDDKSEPFYSCCMTKLNEKEESTEATQPKSPEVAVTPPSSPVAKTLVPDPDGCDTLGNELCAHKCIPSGSSYKCVCRPGFKLRSDSHSCQKIDSDRCLKNNPCQHKCVDTGDAIACSCQRGFELLEDNVSCIDIDECQIETHKCKSGKVCVNTIGSYKCVDDPTAPQTEAESKPSRKITCPPGYKANKQNLVCDDINECDQNPCPPGRICVNTLGSFTCSHGGVAQFSPDSSAPKHSDLTPTEEICPPGFRLHPEIADCVDIDECAEEKDDCNRMSQFCLNMQGSFFCQNKASKTSCPPGYKIVPGKGCVDIDECAENPDICAPDSICVNDLGSYDCKIRPPGGKIPLPVKPSYPASSKPTANPTNTRLACPKGYKRTYNGGCADINECLEGIHSCDEYQECHNTLGNHRCVCRNGFKKDPITLGCIDINECQHSNMHDCIDGQRCDNTIGSYQCIRYTSCGTGYTLNAATGICEDDDECSLGSHNCHMIGSQYECLNTRGTFRCIRRRLPATTPTTTTVESDYYYEEEYVDVENTSTTPNVQPSATEINRQPEYNRPETRTTEATTPARPSPVYLEQPRRQESTPSRYTPPSVNPTYEQPRRPEPPRYTPSPPRQPESTPPTYERPRRPDATPPTYERPRRPDATPPTYDRPRRPEQTPPTYEQPRRPEQTPPTYEQPRRPEPTQPTPEQPRIPDLVPIMPPPISYQPTAERYPPVRPVEDRTPIRKEDRTHYIPDGNKRVIVVTPDQDGNIAIDTNKLPENTLATLVPREKHCLPGYAMNHIGECDDIDECLQGKYSCSSESEVCRNTAGAYMCVCASGYLKETATAICRKIEPIPAPPQPSKPQWWARPRRNCNIGYQLDVSTNECIDIDECADGTSRCARGEICINTQGGYRCQCGEGYHSVHGRCLSLEPPTFTPPPVRQPIYPSVIQPTRTVQVTRPPPQSFCSPGYRLAENNHCVDIDECALNLHSCTADQQCINAAGGYLCRCAPGHKVVNDVCVDIDECTEVKGKACSHYATCVNTIGSFRCDCKQGFTLSPNSHQICTDIDECESNGGKGICHHKCINTWGAFRCACDKGFRLQADNRTCLDFDECADPHRRLCIGQCVNTPGSYKCGCPKGYRLGNDQRNCIDVDECETGELVCGAEEVCQNVRGGARCNSISCPSGYARDPGSKHRCRKIYRTCRVGDMSCLQQPDTYSYNFITFVSKLYIPAGPNPQVDLFTMKGPNWPGARLDFQLNLIDVRSPPGVEPATLSCFNLNQSAHQALISLGKQLLGPQDIHLELAMKLYSDGNFEGTAVAKVFIYISEYEF
ncbi:uncharacterized protein LOC143920546 [Arctopsyche grandis]|uniref:uncharacterized protein LOC143920546 n=1 Tax=Arctopsyche grandis TaxID=121162 RepID=UPI00406D97E5